MDDNNIPTGQLGSYPGVVPNKEFTLGSTEPAFDHCFVMDTDSSNIPLDTRQRPLKRLCQFYHPNTSIHLEVLSSEPAFQFYTGSFINVPAVDGVPSRGPRSGMCIEASRYVNAINDERWRKMVVIEQGQIWVSFLNTNVSNVSHQNIVCQRKYTNDVIIIIGRAVVQLTELGRNSSLWRERVISVQALSIRRSAVRYRGEHSFHASVGSAVP